MYKNSCFCCSFFSFIYFVFLQTQPIYMNISVSILNMIILIHRIIIIMIFWSNWNSLAERFNFGHHSNMRITRELSDYKLKKKLETLVIMVILIVRIKWIMNWELWFENFLLNEMSTVLGIFDGFFWIYSTLGFTLINCGKMVRYGNTNRKHIKCASFECLSVMCLSMVLTMKTIYDINSPNFKCVSFYI